MLVCFLFVPWGLFAQGTSDFYSKPYRQGNGFSIRGGLNYSMPTVTAYSTNNSLSSTIFWGVRPRTGFYIGGSYYTDLLINRISLRIDATLQLKRTGNIDLAGRRVLTSQYYYAGIRPLLGLQLTKRLVVYTGAEANLLIISKGSWDDVAPLDIGATIRFSYQLGPYGVEIGYYRGFTKYDGVSLVNLPGGPTMNDFYNQTFEAGVIYRLK